MLRKKLQIKLQKCFSQAVDFRLSLHITMSLTVCSLNSGSNGNCYYIANQHEAVLVDAGLSCRETERRMLRLGLSIKKVKAIFITHEHADHIKGIASLVKKYQFPVYITTNTLISGQLNLKEHLVLSFQPGEPVRIGDLRITAFPKLHDACDPHSFILENDAVRVGVFTDIGYACNFVTHYFSQCHAAFLEANYDEEMLENGRYPLFLKNRIRDGRGHLSNKQAAELFITHKSDFMSHLFLSHLSRNNNSPKLVEDLFNSIAGSTEIVIASRDKETELYHITTRNVQPVEPPKPTIRRSQLQLSLF
jgi:phosphoribosyl 1,2-cyclic phosphodiesterase